MTTSEKPLQSLQIGPMPPFMDPGKEKEKKLKLWLEFLPNVIKQYQPQSAKYYLNTGSREIDTDYFERDLQGVRGVLRRLLKLLGIEM